MPRDFSKQLSEPKTFGIGGHLVRLIDDNKIPIGNAQLAFKIIIPRQNIHAYDATIYIGENIFIAADFFAG